MRSRLSSRRSVKVGQTLVYQEEKLQLMLWFTSEIAQRRASIHKFTDAVHTLKATLNAMVSRKLQLMVK